MKAHKHQPCQRLLRKLSMLNSRPQNNSLAKELAASLTDGGWRAKARPEQLPPPGEWNGWIVCAGRGFGKTRCGSEWVQECAERHRNAGGPGRPDRQRRSRRNGRRASRYPINRTLLAAP